MLVVCYSIVIFVWVDVDVFLNNLAVPFLGQIGTAIWSYVGTRD
jgi:hypothetical protein